MSAPTTVTYACQMCGHPYGPRVPSAAVVALHLAVSHSGKTPIEGIES